MNPEVKGKWLEAILGGEYEQITDKLYDGRNGTIRCCVLGVLNDISGLGQWTKDGLYEVRDVDYLMEDLWSDYVLDHMDERSELADSLAQGPDAHV
jgi:hypothetical protein